MSNPKQFAWLAFAVETAVVVGLAAWWEPLADLLLVEIVLVTVGAVLGAAFISLGLYEMTLGERIVFDEWRERQGQPDPPVGSA